MLSKPTTARRPTDESVNGYEILHRVTDLPISTWRYEWEPAHVRHLGPMAQDWMAAFGFGQDDEVIHAGDASGVALVCIQALHREIGELRAEVDRLRAEIDRRGEASPQRSGQPQPGPAGAS